jgi:hypothetical protein
MHTDDSDVTFNICLGREFTGAKLEFCGQFGKSNHRQSLTSFNHAKGTCIVHLGKQRHGACNILTGERINLIIWNKSLQYRSLQKSLTLYQLYPKEESKPDLICLSHTHDRDYHLYEGHPGVGSGTNSSASSANSNMRPWCPPKGKEHEGSPLLVNNDNHVETKKI